VIKSNVVLQISWLHYWCFAERSQRLSRTRWLSHWNTIVNACSSLQEIDLSWAPEGVNVTKYKVHVFYSWVPAEAALNVACQFWWSRV